MSIGVYRNQPWQSPTNPGKSEADAEQAYREYLQLLQQKHQNASQDIYNQISTQQANTSLANTQLNFANDAYRQALAQSQMSGNLAELAMRQQQARNNMLLDLKQLGWQREQQKLNMMDDIQRTQYQRATQQVPSPFQVAMQRLGY